MTLEAAWFDGPAVTGGPNALGWTSPISLPGHAVLAGETAALCGVTIDNEARGAWPPIDGNMCEKCALLSEGRGPAATG